jgi:1-acyl-sn-glycerol-3-phosphate acyltransferase
VRYEPVDHLPATGPAIVLSNHLSTTETLALARLITGHHRFPHFLTKAEVFSRPIVGAC